MADGLNKNLNDANKSAKDLKKNAQGLNKELNETESQFGNLRGTLEAIS